MVSKLYGDSDEKSNLRYQRVSQCILDMINIFEVFLPQLLRYPNPTDPLNGEAAALLMREPTKYEAKVKGLSCAGIHYAI